MNRDLQLAETHIVAWHALPLDGEFIMMAATTLVFESCAALVLVGVPPVGARFLPRRAVLGLVVGSLVGLTDVGLRSCFGVRQRGARTARRGFRRHEDGPTPAAVLKTAPSGLSSPKTDISVPSVLPIGSLL